MYYLVFPLFWLLSLLHLRVLYVLADCVYPIIHYVVRYRLKVVRQNLREAFPEKSQKELRHIEARYYHLFCDYFVENIKLTTMSPKQFLRRVTFSNIEAFHQMVNEGKQFTFFCTGHYGNWEWGAALCYMVPNQHVLEIYHRVRNRALNRILLRNRARYGCECVKMRHTLFRLAALRKTDGKYVVGFIADQQPKWNAIHHFTPFLHHDTAVFTGAERIAKKFDAAMVYGRVTRPKRGYYHFEIIPISSQAKQHPDYELTDRYMQLLEEDIQREPYLWLWSHKRWTRTKEEWLRRQAETTESK